MGEPIPGKLHLGARVGIHYCNYVILYLYICEGESMGFETDLGLIPICALAIFVTLCKLMNVSKAHFSHP